MFRLLSVRGLSVGLAISALAACVSQSGSDSLRPTLAPDSGAENETRYDQPGEAAAFYLRQRLAPGMRDLPVERLLAGRAQMKNMAQVASGTGQVFATELDVMNRAPDSILAAWQELGPGNVGGRTRSLLIDPTAPNTMYAGSVGGGVWKTTNAGANWSPVSDTMANIAVTTLAMDPGNSQILYAGTGEGSFNVDAIRGAGIFKSTNGGSSWSQLASTTGSNFYYVNDLLVAPSNSQVIVAATNNGIFVSTNGGGSFTQRSSEVRCMDLSVTTITGTDTWLAACGNFSQGKVLRSTDTTSWPQTLGTDPLDSGLGRLAVAIRGTRAYAIGSSRVPGPDRTGDGQGDYNNQLHAFYRSDDGGSTWTATVRNTDVHRGNTMLLSGYFSCSGLQLGIGQGWYDITVAIDPVDSNIVWVGGVNLFRSNDGGSNWGKADNIHPDHHLLVFHPQFDGSANQTLFNTQDGGIYRSNNARAAVALLPASTGGSCSPTSPVVSWTSLNNQYAVTQFYHGTAYPSGTSYLAGAQDNGTSRGTDAAGPNAWTILTCGDGGYTAVDPSNTNVLYSGCQFGNDGGVQKSTNGSTFAPAVSGIAGAEGGAFIPPLQMDPNNSQRLWFGGTRAWRTDNAAGSWSGASTRFNSGNDDVTAIAVATGNSNLVLMAGFSGSSRIHRTTTATTDTSASAWSSTAVSGYVSALAFAPSDANIAYASISTFGAVHVLKSIDGGATWSAAAGSGGGALPDVPALGIVVHPNDPNRVWVGTDIGVFVTQDGGANWAAEITSFPNVSTEWLQIIGTGNSAQLFAFTHGRGAFRLSLAAGPGTLGFGQSSQSIAEGSVAQVQVNRTSGSDGAVAVTYQTANGSAASPGDFTGISGTLNWAAGDSAPKTISVTTINDGVSEADETFTVTLSAPTGGATLGTSTHTVTLRDQGVFPPNCVFPTGYSTPGDGSVAWQVATDSVHEGTCSLRTPTGMANSSNARIQTSGNFQAGNLTFFARVSSEAGWDCFRFLLDGVAQNIGANCANIGGLGQSGDIPWQQYTVAIPAGSHTLTWSYEKDTTDSGNLDAAWIDLVTLPALAGSTPSFTSTAPGNGTFGTLYSHTYTASGSPAPTFALQSGTFPPGLSLVSPVLSGTPTQAGTFTGVVRASNSNGNADQVFSITIAAIAPGAPSIIAGTPGNAEASISFNAPGSTGGAAILDYTASCSNGGTFSTTGPGSPLTVTGLTNGLTYSCTVRARNSVGPGPDASAVNVTPIAVSDNVFGNGFE